MTLQEFKCEAQRRENYYDNSANAAAHWAKSWGLTYHSLLWYYKRYTIGNLTWKGGKVRLRHGSYPRVECFIGNEQVSEYRFKKALEAFVTPPLTDEEKRYIEAEQQRLDAIMREVKFKASRRKSLQEADIRQLSFNFAV
jgi:hypothetical protein